MSLMGLDVEGPIETFVLPIAFAILFGLRWTTWCSSRAASARSTFTA